MSGEIRTDNIDKSIGVAVGRGATANVTLTLPDTRPEAVIHLPPLNERFTGRTAQLAAIAKTFGEKDNRIAITQAISGLGGVGKTQLAIAYAYTHRDQYDMIWLLQADGTITLDSELRQLGTTLGLDLTNIDADTARKMVLSALGTSKKQWLLLYDNADNIPPRELRHYLPSGGHLLITSRRAATQWGNVARPLILETFTPDEADAFWQNHSFSAEDVLTDLTAALDHLPLAMEQAAAFMHKQQMAPADYLAWFKEQRDSLWANEDTPDDYPFTVATTWKIGFDHAQKQAGAADLLHLCCFFAPDGIPLALIKAGTEQLPPQLAELVTDKRQLMLAVTALRDYSLARQDEDGNLSIHRLVQTVARDRMSAEQRAEWGHVVIELLIANLGDWKRLHEWADGKNLLPHMITVAESGTQQNWGTERLAYLCNKVGYYLIFLGEYTAARPFYEQALAIRQQVLGDDHSDTANSLNNMGSLLNAMGELAQARPYLEQALAIRQQVLGDDHPDTAQSLNNMGTLLNAMGELAQAQPLYKQALAIRQQVLGDDHSDTANSLNNMGS
ncbi:MAG: tetratricopeptide repeat protein, partial [Chloroflexi bacterium]|nr:tetratricopeptide repeat protein [Chloroflexota bacterium]